MQRNVARRTAYGTARTRKATAKAIRSRRTALKPRRSHPNPTKGNTTRRTAHRAPAVLLLHCTTPIESNPTRPDVYGARPPSLSRRRKPRPRASTFFYCASIPLRVQHVLGTLRLDRYMRGRVFWAHPACTGSTRARAQPPTHVFLPITKANGTRAFAFVPFVS